MCILNGRQRYSYREPEHAGACHNADAPHCCNVPGMGLEPGCERDRTVGETEKREIFTRNRVAAAYTFLHGRRESADRPWLLAPAATSRLRRRYARSGAATTTPKPSAAIANRPRRQAALDGSRAGRNEHEDALIVLDADPVPVAACRGRILRNAVSLKRRDQKASR